MSIDDAAMEQPLQELKARLQGSTVFVRIYPDRLEWGRKSKLGTGAKAALGVATVGVSLLATGIKGHDQVTTAPARSIMSVGYKKGGGMYTVTVHTMGGTALAFGIRKKSEAERFTQLVQQVAAQAT